MSGTLRRSAGLAFAATAAIGLVGAGAGTAAGGPHAKLAKTPHISVTVSGKSMTVSGTTKFRPGRVALTVTGGPKGGTVGIGKLKKGYSFHDFRADLSAFNSSFGQNGPSKSGLKHLRHAASHINGEGGLAPSPGQKLRGTVMLPTAGKYVLWNFSGSLPRDPHKLVVKGSPAKRANPGATATVKAKSSNRFGGDKNLPADGTITFKNVSSGTTASPHFLELMHVQQGTTRKDVQDWINAGAQGNPPWAAPDGAGAGTDIVSPGHAMTLSYKLPAGEYLEACFFPDLHTGMPHFFMGMYRLVTLK